jgi:hypothetical protein
VNYLLIDVTEEEPPGTSAANPNARFRVIAPGFEKLVVQFLAAEDAVGVAVGFGNGTCP